MPWRKQIPYIPVDLRNLWQKTQEVPFQSQRLSNKKNINCELNYPKSWNLRGMPQNLIKLSSPPYLRVPTEQVLLYKNIMNHKTSFCGGLKCVIQRGIIFPRYTALPMYATLRVYSMYAVHANFIEAYTHTQEQSQKTRHRIICCLYAGAENLRPKNTPQHALFWVHFTQQTHCGHWKYMIKSYPESNLVKR